VPVRLRVIDERGLMDEDTTLVRVTFTLRLSERVGLTLS